ncbi:MAG: hypothetical protein V7L23_02795 [Nostoc sp.]|uniref:hypothetical protein n=1 Tax=Nostoc sp. TaxID=1180 RepID=UPI002FF2C037
MKFCILFNPRYLVKQFWILDLQFGIDPDHKGTGLGDLRLTILDLFRLTSGGA